MGGGGDGARVSNFFTKNPNKNRKICLFFFRLRGEGGQRRLQKVIFSYKEFKAKKKPFCGVRGMGGEGDKVTDFFTKNSNL